MANGKLDEAAALALIAAIDRNTPRFEESLCMSA
jgi:hypothetical protein